MDRILVSACLLGQPVRHDGAALGGWPLLEQWQAEGRVVPLCPEVGGGLPTPRPPAEIPGGQGAAVLDGRVPVRTVDGRDVTREFMAGAELALGLVRRQGIRFAVLKARSPSCGNSETYDGSFSGTRIAGEGVTAAALRRHGVRVFNETELEQLAGLLDQSSGGTKR